MLWVQVALFLVGLVLLVIGYGRNRRGLLVAAALIWLLAGGVADFAQGFADGDHGMAFPEHR